MRADSVEELVAARLLASRATSRLQSLAAMERNYLASAEITLESAEKPSPMTRSSCKQRSTVATNACRKSSFSRNVQCRPQTEGAEVWGWLQSSQPPTNRNLATAAPMGLSLPPRLCSIRFGTTPK